MRRRTLKKMRMKTNMQMIGWSDDRSMRGERERREKREKRRERRVKEADNCCRMKYEAICECEKA
jgi:hypothetical protein